MRQNAINVTNLVDNSENSQTIIIITIRVNPALKTQTMFQKSLILIERIRGLSMVKLKREQQLQALFLVNLFSHNSNSSSPRKSVAKSSKIITNLVDPRN